MPSARERWFAQVLQAGLETRVLSELDILRHATPAVLTASLPRDVLVRVIDAGLASGAMSHKAILEVVTVAMLVEKVPPDVVWKCLVDAAERTGISDAIPSDEASAREFLRRALESALEVALLTPKDIVQQINAQVLGMSLPEALTTKLLEVTLAAGKMTPELIIETLGTAALAEHVSTKVVWSCFVKPAEAPAAAAVPIAEPRRNSAPTKPPPLAASTRSTAPAAVTRRAELHVIDDDVSSMLVDLEISGHEAIIESKPVHVEEKAKPGLAAKPSR